MGSLEKEGKMRKKKYHICKECNISHYDNCQSCFGFGINKESGTAISAGYAVHKDTYWFSEEEKDRKINVIPCPECKSTLKGVPK